ncbi:transglutaminase family protein [Crenobacter caeni]|uniref:Transglutaminase family protein n=1 Tax=Crenobacter caeni TaxID=2705474 RepID=A0A6B2KR99_9NEIS|nr:transglutaminase family protein [Crenobacter caeni]NDV12678.1 transglutaminase family protein [Crenobacter caeni]
MRLSIRHETCYRYDGAPARSTQLLRLTPADSAAQRVLAWRLVLPGPASETVDGFGNRTHLVTLEGPHHEIRLLAEGEVETRVAGPDPALGPLDVRVYLRPSALTAASAAIAELAAGSARSVAGCADLAARVLEAMPYRPGVTSAGTTAAAALALGAGVCQDHTQVFVAACRTLALPARYVSGYLLNEDETHAASHAWAEVWLDHAWHGFDVSNARAPDEHHLRLAVGLDYLDACPVRGVRQGGGAETHRAHADVRATDE